jgi:hypothetical protein
VQSSARWANAIIAAGDDQARRAGDAAYRHIIGLRSAPPSKNGWSPHHGYAEGFRSQSPPKGQGSERLWQPG